jgi:Uma2 family endonuclease
MLDEVRTIVNLLMKRPITEEIAMQVKAIPGYKHLEITNGQWVGFDDTEDEMTTGEEHGNIEALLIILMGGHVLSNKLGRVYPGDVTFVLDGQPDGIQISREPDVSFLSAANVTPSKGFIYGAPDLAVEIVSPSQDYDEMFKKSQEYFHAGTRQVWIVLPNLRQIDVLTPDGKVSKNGVSDTISGGNLLPGFTLNVADIFEV